jgi:4'-phosphopantetheinyl transferase
MPAAGTRTGSPAEYMRHESLSTAGGNALEGELRIGDREVHVWTIRLETSARARAEFLSTLSASERARLEALRGEELSGRYALFHGALRALLEGYTGEPAAQIVLRRDGNGKPRLSGPTRLKFNMSDSGGIAVYAFALDCAVGVDVEAIRPLRDDRLRAIARVAFCAAETAELWSLPPGERLPAFYRGWTRKEAYVKAVGEGLSMPLDRVRVSLRADEAARIVELLPGEDAPPAWTLHHLEPAPGWVGALAYRSAPRRVISLGPRGAEDLLPSLRRIPAAPPAAPGAGYPAGHPGG